MRIGTMLGDVLWSLWNQPVTEKYPFEKREAPTRLRGKLNWDPDKCTGCGLCSKECPSNAVEVITLDKKNKRFVMRYHMDRCTYCGQCAQNCRFDCIDMASADWELAGANKEAFTVYYGNNDELAEFMAAVAAPDVVAAD